MAGVMLHTTATELPRLMACNGSRLMAGEIPPSAGDDTAARDEGIAAHHMAATVFNGRAELKALINTKAPNGVFMTPEMAEHVGGYLEIIGRATGYSAVEYDTSHGIQDVYQVAGRCDWFDRANSVLRVSDFKYGYRIVDQENNWTTISHAIGLTQRFRDHPFRSIELSVFQPRPYHPEGAHRVWRIDADILRAKYDEMLSVMYHPKDELHTSPWCGECKALAKCPAARRAECNAIDATEHVFSDTISNELLSFTLDNLSRAATLVKQRFQAFEELAKHRIGQGQVIDNYGTDVGLGNRDWLPGLGPEMIKALTGKDLSTPKMMTPAAAEREGVPKAVVNSMTHRPHTGVKLIRASANKRAEKVFGKKGK